MNLGAYVALSHSDTCYMTLWSHVACLHTSLKPLPFITAPVCLSGI